MTFSIYGCLVLVLTVLIISSNVLIVLVLLRTDPSVSLVNWYFVMSLTVSDLCIGLFVAPFSFWTSLFDRWIYGDRFCHVQAYLTSVFWIASIYSLAWTGVDQYIAVRKPDRHRSIMTRTRSVCWVVLLWTAAACFCLPSVGGGARARYHPPALLCVVDWRFQKAYYVTSGLIVVLPPFLALAVVNLYVFTPHFRRDRKQGTEISSRLDLYVMNVVINGVYFISWIPVCALQVYDAIGEGASFQPPLPPPAAVQFALLWTAMGNSFWKFPIYLFCSQDFRHSLVSILCNRKTVNCSCSSNI